MKSNTDHIQKLCTVQLKGEDFILLPEKAMHHKESNTLFIADLHFGKITHFRKNGIGLPSGAVPNGLDKLDLLLRQVQPDKVVFLGDLFHSEYNDEWKELLLMIDDHKEKSFVLVEGNHDILSADAYQCIQLVQSYCMGPLMFTHHPMDVIDEGFYNICGHIHPAVRMRGKGYQSQKLACFYFGEQIGILPAFGHFTGTFPIKPTAGDLVYVIVDQQVVQVL